MIYFELYPGDYLRDTSRLSLTEHGAYLRLMLAYYAEEEPLPASFSELFVIAGATTTADKAAVKKVAERYFPTGEDGLRRNGRADEEIVKAQERMAGGKDRKSAKKGNEAERQARTRARRTMLFEDLRAVGVVPDGMASMDELRALHVTHVTGSDRETGAALSRVTGCDMSRVTKGVTQGVNTGNQTSDPTSTPVTSQHSQGFPDGVTEAGRACVLMRQAGCHTTNPSHPDLVAAVDAGVTAEVLRDTVGEGLQRGVSNPFSWAITTALNRHKQGASPSNSKTPGASNATLHHGSADHVRLLREQFQRSQAGSGGTGSAGGPGGPGGHVIDGEFAVVG